MKNKIIERIFKYEGRRISVFSETLRDQEGNESFYDVIYHPNACVVIAINSQDKILFVSQFRMGAKEFLLELPAGVVEDGESFSDCAKRELQEETGYFANHVEKLSSFYSTPGFCNELLHLYLAKDLSFSPKKAEDTEKISLIPMTLDQALENIDKNFIVDAKTICGIYRYQHFLTLSQSRGS